MRIGQMGSIKCILTSKYKTEICQGKYMNQIWKYKNYRIWSIWSIKSVKDMRYMKYKREWMTWESPWSTFKPSNTMDYALACWVTRMALTDRAWLVFLDFCRLLRITQIRSISLGMIVIWAKYLPRWDGGEGINKHIDHSWGNLPVLSAFPIFTNPCTYFISMYHQQELVGATGLACCLEMTTSHAVVIVSTLKKKQSKAAHSAVVGRVLEIGTLVKVFFLSRSRLL